MEAEPRPGPKPKRLYLRSVRFEPGARESLPPPRRLRDFLANLERVGRLIAHGALDDPKGDLLVFRATDRSEAQRILRADPLRDLPDTSYELAAWNPTATGSGVNLDPPPARGAGRLTALDRISVIVRDQAAAEAWYRDVLGLRPRVRDPETGFLEMSLGQGGPALSLVAPRPSWGEPFYSETLSRAGVATGIAFRTDSVTALELRLRHGGARITQAARSEPWGEMTVRFTDPDGNEFLAHQSKPTGRDPEDGPESEPFPDRAVPPRAKPRSRPPRP